jgi:Kef-type K+ transport system membrane component KefB/voltage-gated potassium channel Kch
MEEHSTGFLEALGIFVIAASALGWLGRRIRMPSIVSYVLAGLIVGPLTGWVVHSQNAHDALATVAEMGIVLLLFLVGIELSLDRIKQVGRVAVAAGLGQVVFTAAGGFGLAALLGFSVVESLFLAVALTFSSTVVVVKLLDQKHELHALYGRIAVGIFLVQDLVVVVILTLLAGLGQPEDLTMTSVALGIGRAFAGMGGLLAASLLAARFLLPRVLGWAARTPRVLFFWALAYCFAVVLAARALSLSLEIGAFVAGLSIAQLEVAADLRRRMHPLMSFFIAVFFVSLGARMELGAAGAYWKEAAVLSLFVLIGNPVIFLWIIARYGYSERTSFLTSVTVAQISEFSFIFAAMGVTMNLVGPEILSIVAVVGLVTIALSAYMILYNHELYARLEGSWLLRLFRAGGHVDEEPPSDQLRGHVVVVGMNDLGRRIASELHHRGELVLVVDTDPAKLQGMPLLTCTGDIETPAVLEEVRLAEAKLAISALRIETTNKLFAHRCRALGVPVVVYGFDRFMVEQLQATGPDYVIDARAESGKRLLEELERVGAVPRGADA